MSQNVTALAGDLLWYKDAVVYQLHIKSFSDGNDDGIGDFQGLIQKLDYLEKLGVTTLWLLPFYPSPLRDDGYDIADYYSVHPNYGDLRDFQRFLQEAHKRSLRVVTELVINHTSDQHAWFQRARHAQPGSPERDFYVWSDTPDKYQEARIIFQDFEVSNWSWDPVANAYFWHRFYSHQPDLNFDNPCVHEEIIRMLDFWLGMGVDGLRLDAIPYLYEREGTNCENLPETHAFLKKLRAHVDTHYPGRMFLAEANQWPEDAVAYFGDGDECHTAFHFPVMPRLYMALRMEDRFPILDILDQTPPIPDSCQWLMFLRNHDELTLEMVTDEERDYMRRAYAADPRARINLGIRRRLAPLLDNNRKKLELMNILLFSLPGSPVIYYGDEIGMGDNYYLGDRDGVRTPMQWSLDRNAGFSCANPQKLYLPVIADPEYHYTVLNVENQERNVSSLLWWMRQAIAMRKRYKAFGRGSMKFIANDNAQVLAFVREHEDERILVIANLAKHTQMALLDLADYAGTTPVELSSRNRLLEVKDAPYVVTLGPYAYYWLALEREQQDDGQPASDAVLELNVQGEWPSLLAESREFAAQALPAYLRRARWAGGRAGTIQRAEIADVLPVRGAGEAYLLLVEAHYDEGPSDAFMLPVAYAGAEKARTLLEEFPPSAVVLLNLNGEAGLLYDATYDAAFRSALLSMIAENRTVEGKTGRLVAQRGMAFDAPAADGAGTMRSRILTAGQDHSAIVYAESHFLKLYRRLEEGINPDLEVAEFLSEKAGFAGVPPFAGALRFQRARGEPSAVGLLQAFIPNDGDAWSQFVQYVTRYFERVIAQPDGIGQAPRRPSSLFGIRMEDVPRQVFDLIGPTALEMAALLGKRSAEMHTALASADADPVFHPEPFSTLYQRSLYQSMRTRARRTLQRLRQRLPDLPEQVRTDVEGVVNAEGKLLERLKQVMQRKMAGEKIRIHGDYHLGKVLFTGNDFAIVSFAGEPGVSLGERRLKRSCLRDVASMVRSFHYAAHSPLRLPSPIRLEDAPALEPWADLWFSYVGGVFLNAYQEAVAGNPFVPEDKERFEILTTAYLLHKAFGELNDELNRRPDRLTIPIKGIQQILEQSQGA